MSDEEFRNLIDGVISSTQRAHDDAKRTGTLFITNTALSQRVLDALYEARARLDGVPTEDGVTF